MSREFDDVLNDCLERIATGEDVRQCASRYPEHEEELVPLLSVAAAAIRVAASVSCTPQAKARGLDRMARSLAERKASGWRRVPFWLMRPVARPFVLGLAAALVVVMAAGGTTIASSGSVPGDPLYWVKTTKENISLRVIPRSEAEAAQYQARLAYIRGQEMRRLIARGRYQDAERLIDRINYHLNESAVHAGIRLMNNPVEMPMGPRRLRADPNTARLRASLERNGRALRTELGKLMQTMPPGPKNKVRRLMRESELRYRIMIEAMQNDGFMGGGHFWRVEPPARSSQ